MCKAVLTIDDIASKNTPAIVDYLLEKGIQPILFARGENVERYYDEAVYAVKKGMIVGNHSYSHPAFSSLQLEECLREIDRCEDVLNRLYQDAGVERRVRPFRFPYGDKGGKNKTAVQEYLKKSGFHKVEDRDIPYQWWKELGLDKDMDTFWTFDFEEYRMHSDKTFTMENIRTKMDNRDPEKGTPLFAENAKHILLLHAHDETEQIVPGYYRQFIDYLLKNGVEFEAPRFFVPEED